MNLFSVFDPHAIFSLPLNWVTPLILLLLVPTNFWNSKNPRSIIFSLIVSNVYTEFKVLFNSFPLIRLPYLRVSFFVFIVINNFLGLAPYIFTATSHLTLTLSLALSLWIGLFTIAWVKTTQRSLAHLVPLGSPRALAPFMVLIELVRNIIRPITLSVRLAANIVAGHLLITLIRRPLTSCSSSVLPLIFVGLLLLSILESAVALIQAYVFRVLSSLYLNEVNQEKINS